MRKRRGREGGEKGGEGVQSKRREREGAGGELEGGGGGKRREREGEEREGRSKGMNGRYMAIELRSAYIILFGTFELHRQLIGV